MTRRLARRLLAVLMVEAAFCSVLFAQGPPAQDKRHPPPPWHLVDIWWDVGQEQAFESYSLDVTISDNVPATVNLCIAPIGLGHLNKTPFYGGIQTQADGYTKTDQRLRTIGPGFLFSRWGERSHDAIRMAPGGFCQSSGHEGDFISVRRPYAWSRGKYTYKIVRMDREPINGSPFTWVGAYVHSHAQKEDVFVGSLRFPGEDHRLARQLASFVEIYGPPRPVEEIPRLSVTLSDLRINGKPVARPTAIAEYPEGIPDYAEARGQGTSVVITLGQPIKDRKRRRVDLLSHSEQPRSDPLISKFEILATYTYAKALRDGLSESEAKERGITAAVMGSRARGANRGGVPRPADSNPANEKTGKARTKTLTASLFDQQIADKMGPFFSEVFLPTMKRLVEARLSYERVKALLEIPPPWVRRSRRKSSNNERRHFSSERDGREAMGLSSWDKISILSLSQEHRHENDRNGILPHEGMTEQTAIPGPGFFLGKVAGFRLPRREST